MVILAATVAALVLGTAGLAAERAPRRSVSIGFDVVAGSSPVACGQPVADLGTTGSTVKVTDLRMYVSNVRLLGSGGREAPVTLAQDGLWQNGAVALLDFENGTAECANGTPDLRTEVTGEAPEGDYTGVRFDIGLPFEINHRDPTLQPSPLNLTRLFWSWNAGYKFARIDLRTTGQPQGWVIHLGSTGCAPNAGPNSVPVSCRFPNRPTVTLTGFDMSRDAIALDLAQLFAQTNLDVNQPETARGCMSAPTDSDCAGLFRALGLPFGDGAAPVQRAFRLVPRASR